MIQITAPTVPNPGASAEEWQAFDAACRVADLNIRILALLQADAARATREKHAQAQADTAAAMLANVEAQHRMAAAFALPAAEPTLSAEKRALAIALLGQQAIGIRDTEAALVASIGKQVDAVFALWPKSAATAPGNGAPTSAGT